MTTYHLRNHPPGHSDRALSLTQFRGLFARTVECSGRTQQNIHNLHGVDVLEDYKRYAAARARERARA